MSALQIRLLAAALLCFGGAVVAQGMFPSAEELDAKLEASNRQLRESIIGLRDARLASCKFRANYDCDLADLSGIELRLLDLESKYRRAAKTSQSQRDVERYTKLKAATAEARQQVSDLASAVDEALK